MKCDDAPLLNYDRRLPLVTTPRTEEWTRRWFPFSNRIKFPNMRRVIGIQREIDGEMDVVEVIQVRCGPTFRDNKNHIQNYLETTREAETQTHGQ